MEPATVAGAMVAGALAGMFASFGLSAAQLLDRRAELYFSTAVWVDCLVGALVGGALGKGMVLGALIMLAFWSVLHFPGIQTLETAMPRRFPLFAVATAALAILVLLLAGLAP